MHLQGAPPAAPKVTKLALVLLLACTVSRRVKLEVAPACERGIAGETGEGLLARMADHVLLKTGLGVEALGADLAEEVVFLIVPFLVILEIAQGGLGGPADIADEDLVVNLHVDVQKLPELESLATDNADEGSFVGVFANSVIVKSLMGSEFSIAGLTAIRLLACVDPPVLGEYVLKAYPHAAEVALVHRRLVRIFRYVSWLVGSSVDQ